MSKLNWINESTDSIWATNFHHRANAREPITESVSIGGYVCDVASYLIGYLSGPDDGPTLWRPFRTGLKLAVLDGSRLNLTGVDWTGVEWHADRCTALHWLAPTASAISANGREYLRWGAKMAALLLQTRPLLPQSAISDRCGHCGRHSVLLVNRKPTWHSLSTTPFALCLVISAVHSLRSISIDIESNVISQSRVYL